MKKDEKKPPGMPVGDVYSRLRRLGEEKKPVIGRIDESSDFTKETEEGPKTDRPTG